MNNPNLIIDKALVDGYDMEVDTSGNLRMVQGVDAVVQIAQNRLIATRGTWLYDKNFGNAIFDYAKDHTAYTMTDTIAQRYVEEAISPMIQDGRITAIESVTVISRSSDTVVIQVEVQMGAQTGIISYVVTF